MLRNKRLIRLQLDWPERRHGNDGVPECIGNAGEGGVGNVLLGVEHDRREDDDRHGQSEDEEAELAGARRQRMTEDSQTYEHVVESTRDPMGWWELEWQYGLK